MSRDHRKLRVFHDAHKLVLAIYQDTKNFPKDEWFGIRQQLRKAAVSVPSNIVEGNARRTTKDYCNFLNISLGSACELAYLVTLAIELHLIETKSGERLTRDSSSVVRQLQALVNDMEARLAEEEQERPTRPMRDKRRPTIRNGGPQTEDKRP